MVNAWIVATIVAVVGGAVGFFVVLRGSAFVAHAVPNGSFAGAAAASLVGVNALIGLGVFSLGGALGIGLLGRRGRHDVATALDAGVHARPGRAVPQLQRRVRARRSTRCCSARCSGSAPTSSAPTIALALVCLAALAVLYRPLLLSSALPDSAQARGIAPFGIELGFLLLVALATTMTVPVVGTALIFSLMIGPPAAARAFTDRPWVAIDAVGRDRADRRLGGDRAVLPDQLAGRVLRRHGQRRGLRDWAGLALRPPQPARSLRQARVNS